MKWSRDGGSIPPASTIFRRIKWLLLKTFGASRFFHLPACQRFDNCGRRLGLLNGFAEVFDRSFHALRDSPRVGVCHRQRLVAGELLNGPWISARGESKGHARRSETVEVDLPVGSMFPKPGDLQVVLDRSSRVVEREAVE